jgi:hypothetical protein
VRQALIWAAAVSLAAGCRRDTVVSVRLVDARASASEADVPSYQVEVRQTATTAPVELLDQLWRRVDRVDTVPNIRTPAKPAVLGDTLVVGLGALPSGSVDLFRYDVRSRDVVRNSLPTWLQNVAFTPPPAFSPEARYLALLTQVGDGRLRFEVRSWPDGAPLVVSAPVKPNPGPYRGAITWHDSATFTAGYPIMSDTGPVWLLLRGRAGGASAQLSVQHTRDSRPTIVTGPEQRAQAPVPNTALLPLDSFPSLPPNVRKSLERRGCSVPQTTYADNRPNNVVHGEFARRGQTDWAALCATGDSMVVVVVWGGPSSCPDMIAATKERISPDIELGTADSAYIQRHEEFYGEGRPYPITHDGIDVGIMDKASSIWYCHEGTWRLLPGAD